MHMHTVSPLSLVVSMSVILLRLWVQLNNRINTHDGNASLDSTLELFDLAHARFEHTSLEAVVDPPLHQVETVVLVGLLLGDGLLFLVGIAFLYALREGVADTELGDEFGGVLGCVDSQGLGDDEEGLGEFADGELLAGAL